MRKAAPMQPFAIRRAMATDVAAVRDITRAAYAKWVPLIGREPLPMRANHEHAIAAHIIDLYEEGGQTIALIEAVPKPDHLLIENIAVRPDRHGAGIGGVLVEHASTLARLLGLGELRLYTNAAFASNIDFYLRRGFTEFQREAYPTGGVVVHMKKPVAA
jgi:N-acetylglutamate synthase-like GNAT family acetyltransferase